MQITFNTKFDKGQRVIDVDGVTGYVEAIDINTDHINQIVYTIAGDGKNEGIRFYRGESLLKLAPEILAPELAWAEAGVRITKAVYHFLMITNLFNIGPLDEMVRKQIRRQTYVFLGGNKISFNEKTEEGRKNKARVRHLIAMAEGLEG